jgi:hypothetical protein
MSTMIPRLRGYFQTCDGVTQDFKNLLTLPDPEPLEDEGAVLLHIRGGDYKNNSVHGVNLDVFRRAALSLTRNRKKVLVFTNDTDFASTKAKTLGLPFSFIDNEDELKLLSNIAASSSPLVCANSTFSWWAGALSAKPRLIVLPRTWFVPGSQHDPEDPLFHLPGSVLI